MVTRLEGMGHGSDRVGPREPVSRIVGSTLGSLLGRRIEIDLDGRLRKDDGPDIPPLHHYRPGGRVFPLTRHQHLPHPGHTRHGGRRHVNLGRPDHRGDVLPVDQDPVLVDLEQRRAGHLDHDVLIVERPS